MYTSKTSSLPFSTSHCKTPAVLSFSQVVRITFGSTDNVGNGMQFIVHVCSISRLLGNFPTLRNRQLFYSQVVAFPLIHKIQEMGDLAILQERTLSSCLLMEFFPCLPSLEPDKGLEGALLK